MIEIEAVVKFKLRQIDGNDPMVDALNIIQQLASEGAEITGTKLTKLITISFVKQGGYIPGVEPIFDDRG